MSLLAIRANAVLTDGVPQDDTRCHDRLGVPRKNPWSWALKGTRHHQMRRTRSEFESQPGHRSGWAGATVTLARGLHLRSPGGPQPPPPAVSTTTSTPSGTNVVVFVGTARRRPPTLRTSRDGAPGSPPASPCGAKSGFVWSM